MGVCSCVSPEGRFLVGIHDPGFEADNLREKDGITRLGSNGENNPVDNKINFPESNVIAEHTDRIYEIANPFSFRGTTFINSAWADRHRDHPETICLPPKEACSLTQNIRTWQKKTGQTRDTVHSFLNLLPRPLVLALAQASTDPEELSALAAKSCSLQFNEQGLPTGIAFSKGKKPEIQDHELFDVLGNNPCLPDAYKEVMVLRPGIQGTSEILGEFNENTHVFEYLRRNSYIPWGHFAANMANDEIRYRACDLKPEDMRGLRHLYYQRIYLRLARELNLDLPPLRKTLSPENLETLRLAICSALEKGKPLRLNASLWGWNFGFGFAQSGHRLHASHQMIHQQNAMVPSRVKESQGGDFACFSAGDMVTEFIKAYKKAHEKAFFPAYIKAIKHNTRTDNRLGGPSSLILHEDDFIILFAPKAQVCEYELQIITKAPCSNILEAAPPVRKALDAAMLKAIQTLEALGAQMVTAIEYSGRFDMKSNIEQHLVYSFIPRLPYAPPTFSEAQNRWITGAYPEDFAQACRQVSRRKNDSS